jgi:hypothetical protein
MTDPKPAAAAPAIPMEHLRTGADGRRLGNRRALVAITGRTAGSINVLAGTDEHFPPEIERGPGRTTWYYLDDLLDWAEANPVKRNTPRPAPSADAEDDDLDALLGPKAAAAELGIAWSTFPSYVRDSVPFWERGEAGRLPIPDEETPRGTKGYVNREWKRRTLREWKLPGGRGIGGGRPPASAAPAA